MVTLSPIRRCAKTGAPRPAILEPNEKRQDTEGEGGNRVNLKALCALLRPSVASLGYGLFLAINAASVWGGVFPFLPLAFQTPDVMLWFSAAESVAFTATFLASAAGTWFFPAETRHFMVKAVAVPYMGGWCLLIGAMYLNGAAVGLSCAGGTLLGVGSAGFYMLWQRLFASQDAREGMGNLIAGTAWAAVLYFALYLIPVAVTAYLIPCVFLPLFGLAAVLKSRTIDLAQPMFEDVPREHGRTYRHVLATIWRPALSLGTLGLCTGIMRSLAIGDPSVGTFVNALSMGAMLVAAVALLAVWATKSLRINVATSYRAFFPVVTTGFLLLPLLGEGYAEGLAAGLYALRVDVGRAGRRERRGHDGRRGWRRGRRCSRRGYCDWGRPGRAATPCPSDDCSAVPSRHHVLHRPGRLPPRAGRHRHQRDRAVGPPARREKKARKPHDRPCRQRSQHDRHTICRLGSISICF